MCYNQQMSIVDTPEHKDLAAPSLLRSAGLISIGNIVSRVLGLVREMVISSFFPAPMVSAFTVAGAVPTMIYDFLIGGMLSAALVPTLSAHLQRHGRSGFVQLAGLLLSILMALLALCLLAVELAAPQVAQLLAGGFEQNDPALLDLTTQLVRLVAPSIWFFGMAGVLTAILYALQRFSFPAFATAIYNLGIILATPLLAARLGVFSAILGILLGSVAQTVVLGWDFRRYLRQHLIKLKLSFDWRHPALRQILRLYLPIALGLVVSTFQIGLDRRLASGTGVESIAWMRYATTLQQLPLGLISVAIALAALPQLSRHFADQDEAAYRATLGRGLRMVLLLIAPAAVALWLLGEPATRILFQRNAFTASDTTQVVQALDIYVVGMLFAAIDFPLNYAFYARNNTLMPAAVGMISVGFYLVVAYTLLDRFGYLGLVWADSAKQAGHALIMLLLLQRTVGGVGSIIGRTFLLILLAAGIMAAAMAGALSLLGDSAGHGLSTDLLTVAGVGGGGLLIYIGVLAACRVPELEQLWQRVAPR